MASKIRFELYSRIDILKDKVIKNNIDEDDSFDLSDNLIFEGEYLSQNHFFLFITSLVIFLKFRYSGGVFADTWLFQGMYEDMSSFPDLVNTLWGVNVFFVIFSMTACFIEWHGSLYLKEMVDELKDLNALTEPPSKESFLKSLDTLQDLLVDEKLTDSEIVKLTKLINDLILFL